jgi:predicted RNA binding protein YcfA (HicA-like mRNA interferase family)
MPKLRRLSGLDMVRILQKLGFEIVRIKGSHHIMRRVVNVGNGREETQTVNVPVHGSQPIATGTLRKLYRDLLRYVSEEQLHDEFYTD